MAFDMHAPPVGKPPQHTQTGGLDAVDTAYDHEVA